MVIQSVTYDKPKEWDGEHELTQEIICPYCGMNDPDSWETLSDGDEDNDDIQCEDCGRWFHAIKHVEVTYSTYPLEDD